MSKLVALLVVRNESWILGYSLRVALSWCDELVILDHGSTDATPKIIKSAQDEYPGRVHCEVIEDPKWNEMIHRQRSLAVGREHGGTHFAIIDADEILCAHLLNVTRQQVLALEPHQLYSLPLVPMWRSMQQFRDDQSIWCSAQLSLAFSDGPGVTWTPNPDGYQFHKRVPDRIHKSRSRPRRETIRELHRTVQSTQAQLTGGVLHCQWADWRRMQAKHLLYQMRETVYHPGRKTAAELSKTYSMASDESDIQLSAAPPIWTAPYERWSDHLNLRQEPWQLQECRELLAQHGRDIFAGLNWFDIVL